jgi:peptide deformylase
MVGREKSSSCESFQKWLPLKIVTVPEIPDHKDLEKFNPDKIENYLKLSVALQIFCSSNNGVGLASVQCGIPNRLFVASEDSVHYRTFIDCKYEGVGEKIDSMEGCLSIKDEKGRLRRFLLKRYKKIRLKGFELILNDLNKKYKEIDEVFEGLFAVVLQHEIDHNDGTLICDIGKEIEVVN